MLELILAATLISATPTPAPALAPALAPAWAAAARWNAGVIQEETARQDIFPAPRTGMTLHVGGVDSEMSMLDLCLAYAEVTGQRAMYGHDTKHVLENHMVDLGPGMDVAPGELQEVFESIMIAADFTVAPIFGGGTPIFKVTSLQSVGRSNLRAGAIGIAAEDFWILEKHPAVLFTTTVHLPNVDVRQLSNSLRTMITDANTQQMLPAGGSHSMVLVGFGSQLADMHSMMLSIDQAAEASSLKRQAEIEVLRIEHAVARDLANLVTAVFQPAAPQEAPKAQSMTILADVRTNSLVIRGTKGQVERVKEFVAELDVPVKGKK